MKIIEALKKIKYLTKKCEDYRAKIAKSAADMDFDTPEYPDMKAKVSEWVQGHGDMIKEISSLKFRIQKTNVHQMIAIDLNNNKVTKSIYEWIQRRRELCSLEQKAWEALTDRSLGDKQFQQTNGSISTLKMRRYYDPAEKAKMVDAMKYEPVAIDSALEIANCTIDLED